jgi:hypothetical protein
VATRDYTSLAGLEEIYLEDSWVLGVHVSPTAVTFDIDFVLTERHPEYRQPRVDEQHCYRRGKLVFRKASKVNWVDRGHPPATDANGEIDYGNIDTFVYEGPEYSLTGGWGAMDLVAAVDPAVEFEDD